MLNFLITHPSIFIIAATIIIIIIIFLFFTKKSTEEYKIQHIERNTDIELQELQPITQRPDEVDTIAPLPGPQLSRKLRYDTTNQPPKLQNVYDTPRVHKFASIPESAGDESSSSFSYVPAELNRPTDVASTSGTELVVHREPRNVIQGQENRVSVSDVYKHGSYVSFDGEFDSYDEFRKSSANTLRLTVDFGANNSNYVVPVIEKI